jgi:transglutaminase-like putative cysteine protease
VEAPAIVKETALTIRVGCEIAYEFGGPTPAVFLVRPDASPRQRLISETWTTVPGAPYHDYTDLFGNTCRRMLLPQGPVTFRYDALVETPPEPEPVDWDAAQHLVQDLPDDVLVYTLPSRYCLSDELAPRAMELFGTAPLGRGCVQTICDWVHDNIRFCADASTPLTTAAHVLESGQGVCRDYAHLAITFCRAMNIPARYVFGYIPDIDVPPPLTPMDFCAWFEAFLGGQWWTFDPRNNQTRKGRVRIAIGRDALDVAMVTTYGAATLNRMDVWADEIPNDGTPAG